MNDQLILNEKEILTMDQTRYYQAIIFASSVLYPFWGYVLSEKFGHYDPLGIRFAICLPVLFAGLLSFKFTWFKNHLKKIFYFAALVAVVHYHVVMAKNHVSVDYIIGGLIFLFILVNVILESKYKMIFAFTFVAMSYFTCFVTFGVDALKIENDVVLHLLGVSTVGLFSFLNFINYNKISKAFLSEIHENTSLRRWSSVGQMAGGIAHEVNTPLSTMILTLENLSDKLDSNKIEQAKTDVANLIRTGEKIGNIVHSLRLLTMTGGKFERDKVSLFEVVIHAKNEHAQRLKENNVDFAYMYNISGDGLVWGSLSSLKLVVSNLVKNAIDAVEGHETKWVKILLVESKTHYKVLVQNSGPQIDKNISERIFEPFFTTKDVGRALGIGLSISKTLILAHNGTISLDYNNPNVAFVVSLPKIKVERKPKEKKAA